VSVKVTGDKRDERDETRSFVLEDERKLAGGNVSKNGFEHRLEFDSSFIVLCAVQKKKSTKIKT